MRKLTMKGFSLIELMIVVAIIGILSAIAIPNFQRFQSKSRQAEVKADLAAIYTAQTAFRTEYQQYSAYFEHIAYAPQGTYLYAHGMMGVAYPTAALLNPNYVGPAATANGRTISTWCGVAPAVSANGCSYVTKPVNPATFQTSIVAPAVTQTTFIATAAGYIGSNASTVDAWTMDNSRTLSNSQSGL